MSKKQWMVLLMLFLTYLLLGASIFYHIESRLEVEKVQAARQERVEINALLHAHYMPESTEDQHEILEKLTVYCGKSVYNYSENEEDPLKWDFYNSFYFAYTVVSTIGYGNLAPTNSLSRILMIFYGLIGIPMNGILLAQLGEFFSIVFIRAHQKYKSYKQHHQDECKKKLTPLEKRKAGLAVQILMYLAPGFVMFIFFPAFLFSYYEGWSYDEAVYYAFVTLTTIGFGDYVAGQDNTKGSGVLFIMYKSFLIAWISFGLGYVVMIMAFITRGMRSKRIVRLEHKLAMNLKQTQSKIWSEFNKEVGYLRRVFNELQLSKVKRVYVDEYDYEMPPAKLMRSNSFPDLRELVIGGLAPPTPPHPRRRANSEVVPLEPVVPRVVSETDLQRIDKTATFATHAMVQPAELLARLVNILGYIPPPPDDDEQSPDCDARSGVECFSDKEILSNECKFGIERSPCGKPRSRAVSEVRLDPKFDPSASRNQEWTWSGPAASRKIQELIRARRNDAKTKEKEREKEKECKSIFPALPKSVPLPKWIKQLSTKKDPRPSNSASAGELDTDDENYLSNMNPLPSSSNYFTHTGANLPSSLGGSNLLEETSLADFLRALTALHTRVGAVPEDYIKKPQRKMGTASLTPPKLPSLLTLFSPPGSLPQSNQTTVTSDPAGRRLSLRPDTSGNSTPSYNRRSSAAPGVKGRTRRFSLRPVATPLGPTPQASPYLGHPKPFPSPPPAYSADPPFESPKEPLVQMEGAPGSSSPVASSGHRRFSLRPAQLDTPPGPATPQASRAMPRWRAGMLQRQINQLHLQKRVRAFSLSDVNTEGMKSGEKSIAISPLALEPSVKTNPGKGSTQKTVTIVSPSREGRGKTSDVKQGRPGFLRAISASSNPFTSGVTNPFFDGDERDKKRGDLGAEEESNDQRTVFEALRDVKTIGTAPAEAEARASSVELVETVSRREDELGVHQDEAHPEEIGGENVGATERDDRTDKTRKISVVSIGSWGEAKRGGRKVSTVSEHSTGESSSSSRKTSSGRSPGDKPRVSIDSYKPLLEVKIDKPSENVFERYQRASMQSSSDGDSLQEVKVVGAKESKVSLERDKGPAESTS
ncbi:open rectifier potassium channel protein 1 [Diachasma alloeum]|uniref:open rectifier potassium channel protein 1 n=1 Tax=Diachasma alloeum TaxID=454923 RepID=UPI000738174C|nr:open rectifier potassium channel protein 1 [Diachasma alloeum]